MRFYPKSNIDSFDNFTFEQKISLAAGYESGGTDSTLAMTNSEESFILEKSFQNNFVGNQEQLKDISNNIALRPRLSVTIKNVFPEEYIEIKRPKPKMALKPVENKKPDRETYENVEVPEEYYEGRLLWGRLKSYPWWPCMIYRSPEKDFYKISKNQRMIHVVYFGPRVERGWINVKDIFSYDGKDKFDLLVRKLIAENASKKELKDYSYPTPKMPHWTEAWKEAELALYTKLIKRIKNHGIMYQDALGNSTISDTDDTEEDEVAEYDNDEELLSVHSFHAVAEEVPQVSEHKVTPEKLEDNGSVHSYHSIASMTRLKSPMLTEDVVDENMPSVSPKSTVSVKIQDELSPKTDVTMVPVSPQSTVSSILPFQRPKRRPKKFDETVSIHSTESANNIVVRPRQCREKPKKVDKSEIDDNESIQSIVSSRNTVVEHKPHKAEPKKLFLEYLNLQAPSFGGKKSPICLLCLSESTVPDDCIISCAGSCSQTFHTSCMKLLLDYVTSKEPETPILNYTKCVDCNKNQRRCFMCKKLVTKAEQKDAIKCSTNQCGRYYHGKCLMNGVYHNLVTHNRQGHISCPSHTCHSCHLENPATVRHCTTHVKCIMCPAAYHKGDWCIPAGSTEIDPFHIICPQHLSMGGSYDMSVAPFMNCVKKGAVTLGKYQFQITSFADEQNTDLWILNKPPQSHRTKPSNVTWCFICSKNGDLICCEKCPASLHQHCAKVDEIPESFLCDECEMGRYPRYGEIFWLKIGNYRWWPAQIIHPKNTPKNVLNAAHKEGQFPVLFFGTDDYHWCNKTQAFMFDEGDDEASGTDDNSSVDESEAIVKNDHSKQNLELAYKVSIKAAGKAYRRRSKKWSDLMIDGKKPSHYRSIKTNMIIGKAKLTKEHNIHQCECRPDSPKNDRDPCGYTSECINRQLNYECNPAYCRNGDKCRNQRFVLRQYPKLEVFNTSNRGWALKTKESIKQGTFVIEYVGEVIDEEEANRRLRASHDNNVTNFYMMELDNQRIIDAGPAANISRFMNHSCSPNVFTQKWLVNGENRIGLFALHDIKSGEELTFNYNFQSLGDMKIPCKCGSSNCSGFLGKPPKTSSSPDLVSLDGHDSHTTKPKPAKKTTAKGAANDRRAPKTKRENTDAGPPIKKVSVESDKVPVPKEVEVVPVIIKKPAMDSLCYVCQLGQCDLVCDYELCPRIYHRQCLNLSEKPDGTWYCCWHFCDDCGRLADNLCMFCPVSFCTLHLADRVLQCGEDGPNACLDHFEMYQRMKTQAFNNTTANNYRPEVDLDREESTMPQFNQRRSFFTDFSMEPNTVEEQKSAMDYDMTIFDDIAMEPLNDQIQVNADQEMEHNNRSTDQDKDMITTFVNPMGQHNSSGDILEEPIIDEIKAFADHIETNVNDDQNNSAMDHDGAALADISMELTSTFICRSEAKSVVESSSSDSDNSGASVSAGQSTSSLDKVRDTFTGMSMECVKTPSDQSESSIDHSQSDISNFTVEHITDQTVIDNTETDKSPMSEVTVEQSNDYIGTTNTTEHIQTRNITSPPTFHSTTQSSPSSNTGTESPPSISI